MTYHKDNIYLIYNEGNNNTKAIISHVNLSSVASVAVSNESGRNCEGARCYIKKQEVDF